MSDTRKQMPVDTTDRENAASFDDWTFETGLPDEDALQRMCRAAASLAVKDLVDDIWLMVHFSDGREAPGPKRLELCIHAWEGSVTLGRPFAEAMLELAQDQSYSNGEMDNDDASALEIIRELEAAVAMIKGRMCRRRQDT
jgi:hypothetical protein